MKRLEEKHEEAVRFVGECTYRVWRLYMTSYALQFEPGSIGIDQVLATGKENGLSALPLTRRDLYEDE